ncbi:MAG: hypothetical protein ACK4K2_00125 [Dehalococcoidia bacterium]
MGGIPNPVRGQACQLGLPGVVLRPATRVARPRALGVGQEVVYLGRVPGGPPKGAWGHVQRVTAWGVWVRFCDFGSWLVPPYFLGVPLDSLVSPNDGAT